MDVCWFRSTSLVCECECECECEPRTTSRTKSVATSSRSGGACSMLGRHSHRVWFDGEFFWDASEPWKNEPPSDWKRLRAAKRNDEDDEAAL